MWLPPRWGPGAQKWMQQYPPTRNSWASPGDAWSIELQDNAMLRLVGPPIGPGVMMSGTSLQTPWNFSNLLRQYVQITQWNQAAFIFLSLSAFPCTSQFLVLAVKSLPLLWYPTSPSTWSTGFISGLDLKVVLRSFPVSLRHLKAFSGCLFSSRFLFGVTWCLSPPW